MSNNAMLRDLRPDTEYKVTLVPIYPDVEGKRVSENGKTSESDRIWIIMIMIKVLTVTPHVLHARRTETGSSGGSSGS